MDLNRSKRQNFNPRTREGCDDIKISYNGMTLTFQSTHP